MNNTNELYFNTVGINKNYDNLAMSYITFDIPESMLGIPLKLKITNLYVDFICDYDYKNGFNNLLIEADADFNIYNQTALSNLDENFKNVKTEKKLFEIPIYIDTVGITSIWLSCYAISTVEGSIQFTFSTNIDTGVQYTSGNGIRVIHDFSKTNFNVKAVGYLDLCVQLNFELRLFNIQIVYAYGSLGYWLSESIVQRGDVDSMDDKIIDMPIMTCIDMQMYPYIHFGIGANNDLLPFFPTNCYYEIPLSDLGEFSNKYCIKKFSELNGYASFFVHLEGVFNSDNVPLKLDYVKECTFKELISGIYNGIEWNLNIVTGYLSLTSTDETPEKETDWKDYKQYIRTVSMDNTITSIPNSAFSNCDALSTVVIPNSVTTIAGYAFKGCTSLTNITIPSSVTSIGSNAFQDSGLVSVVVDCATAMGFYNCDKLTDVTLTGNVTTIGGSAFYDCDALSTVVIPNSVTTIAGYAFKGCTSLTNITIPSSVTSIGSNAFDKTIIIHGSAYAQEWAEKYGYTFI